MINRFYTVFPNELKEILKPLFQKYGYSKKINFIVYDA